MDLIPLHNPCSTSGAAWSCDEVTALMEYIQKPTTNVHGNRCYKNAEEMFGNYPLAGLPCAGSLMAQPSLPTQECCRWRGALKVHFSTGSTYEVRQDLQNYRICEKKKKKNQVGRDFRRWSTPNAIWKQALTDGCKIKPSSHLYAVCRVKVVGVGFTYWISAIEASPVGQLPLQYSWWGEGNGKDKRFVQLWRSWTSYG